MAGIGVVLLLAAGIAGFQVLPGRSTTAVGASKPVAVQTAKVTRTDLATTTSVEGQLGYGAEHPVRAGADGAVTWLPKVGRTLTRGEQLFRVNDQPVMLFYGRTPLFRPLDTTGLVGRDIRMVADNLKALGYSIGDQPAVGTTVRQPDDRATATSSDSPTASRTGPALSEGASAPEPTATPTPPTTTPTRIRVRPGDGVLTTSLRAAIKRWQADAGAARTGTLELGAIVVQTGAVRVSSVTAQLGDAADAPLISVTRTTKVVTVSIEATELEAVRGAKQVTVTLPTGTAARGRVRSISRTVATPDGQDHTLSSTATITLTHPSAIRNLDSAPVHVEFTAAIRKDVLAVPVGALLALREGGYAVQTPTGQLLPVTVGLFAKGLVEVRGTGVDEGTTVVTTS